MPIYEFECENCGAREEIISSIEDKPEIIGCKECYCNANSIISFTANRKEWNPYIDDNLGDEPVLVKSREHRRELMKKAGLRDQYHHKPGMPGQWV